MGKCVSCGKTTKRKCSNCNAYVCVFCRNIMTVFKPCPSCGETDGRYIGR